MRPNNRLTRACAAAALKRALVDDASAILLRPSHAAAPVTAQQAEAAPVTCVSSAPLPLKRDVAATVQSSVPSLVPAATIDLGKKTFEIDNVCLFSVCFRRAALLLLGSSVDPGTVQDTIRFALHHVSIAFCIVLMYLFDTVFRKILVQFSREWHRRCIQDCR